VFCLPDERVQALAALGRRIQAHYGEFPQDIEWALAGGVIYILQSRPITAADFSWDSEVTYSAKGPPMTGTELWGRGWADQLWNGAITPLMFSWRANGLSEIHDHCVSACGFPELESSVKRLYVYYRGKAYYNLSLDKAIAEKTCPPPFRDVSGALSRLPKSWWSEINGKAFDYWAYVKMYARIHLLIPKEGVTWYKYLRSDWIDTRAEEFDGLSPRELACLSDRELKSYIRRHQKLETRYCHSMWTGLLYIYRDLIGLLGMMISAWYDGDNPGMAADLVSGSPEPTSTARENKELWDIAQKIRQSASLTKALRENQGAAFFCAAESLPDGKEFLAAYGAFLDKHGSRGSADRDIYFPRRSEDPSIDYRSFVAFLSMADAVNPEVREEELNHKRNAAVRDVMENIGRKPMGTLKAALVRQVVSTIQDMIPARDDSRYFAERSTFAIKRGYIEVSNRCRERGHLHTPRDHYFLTMDELFDVLDGRANLPLSKAKIEARMKNFDAVNNKEASLPMYIQRGKKVDIDHVSTANTAGVFRGGGTSRGSSVGRARVVKSLGEIGRVQPGEILVTNSTDPGWTPIFMIIKGIVLETGGLLAHGSMLAREYGFPAVQLEDAMQLIPDGARISVDGDAGVVRILPDEVAN
jgi:pyruvate,water dikinase